MNQATTSAAWQFQRAKFERAEWWSEHTLTRICDWLCPRVGGGQQMKWSNLVFELGGGGLCLCGP